MTGARLRPSGPAGDVRIGEPPRSPLILDDAPTGASGGTLVFLDAPGQMEAVGDAALRAPGTKIVAATPQIRLALTERSIPSFAPEAFFELYDLRPLDAELFKTLTVWCARMDAASQALDPDRRAVNLRPFAAHFIQLRWAVDILIVRMREMLAAVAALRPARIVCCAAPPEPVGKASHFEYGDGLYGLLAAAVGAKTGVAVDPVRTDAPPVFETPSGPSGRKLPPRPPAGVAERLRLSAAKGLRTPLRALRGLIGRPASVLMLQPLVDPDVFGGGCAVHQWDCGDGPVMRDGRIAFWPRLPDPAPASPDLWTRLREVAVAENPFVHEGVDFFPALESRLRHVAEEAAPRLFRVAVMTRHALERSGAAALLFTNTGCPPVKAAIDVARLCGVPTIGAPHGQLGDQVDGSWRWGEFDYCDHYLVYTAAAEKIVRDWGGGSMRLHRPGSPHLERVRKAATFSKQAVCAAYGFDPHRPLLIYPTSILNGNTLRIFLAVGDEKLFRIQTSIVDAVARRPDAQLLVKGMYYCTRENMPLLGYIERLGCDRIRFVDDCGFSELLDAADGVVLDHPALTLMESLARDKPLFIVNDGYVWTPGALELLRAETVFEHRLEDFLPRFEAALASGAAFSARRGESAYFRRYGDDVGRGSAARRVAETVAGIIARSPGRAGA